VYRKEGVKQGKVIIEGGKNKGGVKTFSEPACPLTSAYVYVSGHRVRVSYIPHQMRQLNCHFQHQ